MVTLRYKMDRGGPARTLLALSNLDVGPYVAGQTKYTQLNFTIRVVYFFLLLTRLMPWLSGTVCTDFPWFAEKSFVRRSVVTTMVVNMYDLWCRLTLTAWTVFPNWRLWYLYLWAIKDGYYVIDELKTYSRRLFAYSRLTRNLWWPSYCSHL